MVRPYNQNLNGRKISEKNCKTFTGYSFQELIALTGINGIIDVKPIVKRELLESRYPKLTIRIECEGVKIIRILDFRTKAITNELFECEQTGQGYGTNVLRSQVKAAHAAGFSQLRCLAWRSTKDPNKYNGYDTWAKLGYLMHEQYIEAYQQTLQEYGMPDVPLHELVTKVEGGAEFWRKHGIFWIGIFDLCDGSKSRKILNAYANRRKKT